MSIRLLAAALLVLAGCKGKDEDPDAAGDLSGCDPTDPSVCAYPWPSSYFQVDDPSTGSGVRLNYGPEAMPGNIDGYAFDPALLNEKDGYATLTPMLVYFQDVSLDGVIGHTDLGAYAAEDAKTVILNAETGERLPHFVELDMTTDNAAQRTLILRPVTPMEHGTRYVVGIRDLVKTSGGSVDVSEAFAALRDGSKGTGDVEAMRARYDSDIFPVLEADGISRDDLQLAWDFTTASSENLHRDMLTMRDDALSRLPADGPEYTITSVETHDCLEEDIHTTIEGTVTVPRYTDTDTAGAIIARGPDGAPVYSGDTQAEFLIRVPCSLAQNPGTAPMMLQYGHGLLGDRYEARTGWLSRMANERGFVVFAMDWVGMSTRDAGHITLMLATDVSGFRTIPERSQQGLVNKVVGLRMMHTSIVDDPALEFGGIPILDGAPLGYHGNSQGGILGAAYMAVSPDVERGVLGVPGMPYSILLSRSVDFDPFFLIFQQKYTDHREIALILVAMQTLWDPGEPSGYAHQVTRDPLPNTPAKQILLHPAIGDAQVTPLGAHIMARAFDAKTIAPQTRPIWGVDEEAAGWTGSAIVEWDYSDIPDAPDTNTPPDADYDTHECPRRQPEAQAQLADFLLDGVVNQHCTGTCVAQRVGLCD